MPSPACRASLHVREIPSRASPTAVAANRAAPPNALTSRQYQGTEHRALRAAFARSRRSSAAPGALAFVGAFTSMPPVPDGAARPTSHKDSVEPFESSSSAERGPGHNARPAAGGLHPRNAARRPREHQCRAFAPTSPAASSMAWRSTSASAHRAHTSMLSMTAHET